MNSEYVSTISLIISSIALLLSYRAFKFSLRSRVADKKPVFEYSDSFGGYFESSKRSPTIEIVIINTGNSGIIYGIKDLYESKIICSSLNKILNNNSTFSFKIVSKREILKHEDIKYKITIAIKDIDNRKYSQIIEGKGINFEIK